ncbi:hypothetical protein HKX48_009153 [Thoreauomyces humboldtii]|nr:hypothetical protein HKX48_009153 [Thoreauomyces humboldtii]
MPGLNRTRQTFHNSFETVSRQPISREVSPVRTEYGDDAAEDNDDLVSMRFTFSTRTRNAARPRPITKSQKISGIQSVFTENQKVAYVGLCYLSIVQHRRTDIKSLRKATESYNKWADAFMEKLYLFLDISVEERVMIASLSSHGLVPSDLSKSLIEDATRAAREITLRQEHRQRAEQEAMEQGLQFEPAAEADVPEPTDIRYTIISHLFILCIMEGLYDGRSRTVLKTVAGYLEVPWLDVVRLEAAIADQLRIYEDSEAVTGDVQLSDKRNQADNRKRWLFTGLATLAGGAVIGLTAGLAAPLIAGGIGVALGTFGVTGATAALSGTGALALITTGGVLTGGGMGGVKMMKRTKGITQFEFLTLADGLKQIEINKEKRRTDRRKKRRREAREALQEKMDTQRAGKAGMGPNREADVDGSAEVDAAVKKLAEASLQDPEKEEEQLPAYVSTAASTTDKLDRIGSWVNITESQRSELEKVEDESSRGRARMRPPVPRRPTAAELADAEPRLSSSISMQRKPPRATRGGFPDEPPEDALTISSSLASGNDHREGVHEWGLEQGLSWPDTDYVTLPADIIDTGDHLEQVDSTVLWESNHQLHSDAGSAPRSSYGNLSAGISGRLDDTGTIDEDMAAAMFDDLQSTIAGDEIYDDDGIRFKELEGPPKAKQTNVLITVAGWITYGPDDHTLPFSTLEPDLAGDQYALLWETDTLQELGSALKLLVGEVASFLVQQGLQATVLSALMLGLAGPLWVMKLSYLVDNPWGIGLSKANKAGKVLADTLIQGKQENRPVTLIGYSLGARVIFHCLLELAARGAFGLVEEAYLLGCPVMAEKKEWEQIASVVGGRVVNGYSTNDMVLGVLYRASVAVWNNVAGLRPVENVPGVENIALDDVIQGHLDYRLCMPKVLEKLGFQITRDYFDDEDEEEEKERLELEEEQKKEREERLRAKEARLQRKQEEYEEKVRKKKEEQERKLKEREEKARIKEEARLKRLDETPPPSAGSGRMSWFSRRSSGRNTPVVPEKPKEDVVDQLMDDYWMPKEIKSTLPPLIVRTAEDPTSSVDETITPREIRSTLPPLVIRITSQTQESTRSRSNTVDSVATDATATPARLEADAQDAAELLQAEQELAQVQKEVDAAKREIAQARAAQLTAATTGGVSDATHIQYHTPVDSLRVSPQDPEDLETMMRMAGPTSAGAGDLLDSRRDHSEDEDDSEGESPARSDGTTASSAGAFVDAEENPWMG